MDTQQDLPEPDIPSLWIFLCRDIPGNHIGGELCFCIPIPVRFDDDIGFRRYQERSEKGEWADA